MNLTANHQLVDDWEDVRPSVENLTSRDEPQDPPTAGVAQDVPTRAHVAPPRVC